MTSDYILVSPTLSACPKAGNSNPFFRPAPAHGDTAARTDRLAPLRPSRPLCLDFLFSGSFRTPFARPCGVRHQSEASTALAARTRSPSNLDVFVLRVDSSPFVVSFSSRFPVKNTPFSSSFLERKKFITQPLELETRN